MSDGKRATKPDCPLKLEVCYQSCYWWKDEKCTFSWDKIKAMGAVEIARTEYRCTSCGRPIKKGGKFIRHILEFEWYPTCLKCTSRGVGLHDTLCQEQIKMQGEILLKLASALTPDDVRQLKAAGYADEVRAVLQVLEKLTWAWRSTEFEQLDSKVWADLYVKHDKLQAALREG